MCCYNCTSGKTAIYQIDSTQDASSSNGYGHKVAHGSSFGPAHDCESGQERAQMVLLYTDNQNDFESYVVVINESFSKLCK